MAEEGKPPRGRRPIFGRRKEPVLGRRAKPKSETEPEEEPKPRPKTRAEPKPPPRASAKPKPKREPKPTREPKPKPDAGPEDDVVARRISAVVILLVVAVVIMWIADLPPFFDDVTEEERVADTVERFFDAYGGHDFETVCGLFSPAVVNTIETAGATETREKELQGCADILGARFDGEEPTEIKVEIENVRISGQRAVAETIVKTEGAGKGRPLPVELERGPDGWLITRQVITG